MCGIFGLNVGLNSTLTQKEIKQLLNGLFILSESRGKEASGFAFSSNESITVYKTPEPASKLIKTSIYRTTLDSYSQTKSFTAIGHSRLVTNGFEDSNLNNQPVIKKDSVLVHNGIVVNVETLWEKYKDESKETQLDTEIIPSLIGRFMSEGKSLKQSVSSTYGEIYGMTTIASLFSKFENLLIATNNGSLYYCTGNNSFIFASEQYILGKLIDLTKAPFDKKKIKQLKAGSCLLLNKSTSLYEIHEFDERTNFSLLKHAQSEIKDISDYGNNSFQETPGVTTLLTESIVNFRKEYEQNAKKINTLKRCSKCILPETFPFIDFDSNGICNYCRYYKKIEVKGEDALKKLAENYRKNNNEPECLVPFSGGRDSSYALHYIVKELKLKPLAYSYDWGMVTDLARRNQARLCGKLGVEHIYISADIKKKRENIRKNVAAWLKRPNLGTIPLFMAGDKQYFYFANLLLKQNNLTLSVLGENMLETTNFKSGFCGIKPKFGTGHTYSLSAKDKVSMAAFYGKEYLINPAYINSSILDTLDAFKSYYMIPHKNLNIFDYLEWNEEHIISILLDEYNWETSPDTVTTWRIGDGTAAFYNYIYYTVAGFTEMETFRSNQIREGVITREEAMAKAEEENIPRWESLKWYLDIIGLDFDNTLKVINNIPKLYNKYS